METKEQKEKRLTKVLNKLENGKVDRVLELINWPLEDLKEMKKRYWDAYRQQEEDGNILSSQVIRTKYWIVDEALRVKRGNEEQAWDYLT